MSSSPGRRSLRSSLLALVLSAGCANSYSMVGYDVGSRTHGVLVDKVGGGHDGQTGSFAAGFAAGPISLEAVVHGHDLETTADRWLSASGGLELKVRVLTLGPTQTFIHGGAMRAILLDRDDMNLDWGIGYAYGGTFAVGKWGVRAYVDAHVEELTYAGSEVNGQGTIATTTAGIMLGK
ncbi:MAG TPA: hypothetical protein VHE35_02915 [Kofleriaceae bacterium]|nr:hypothetical protein [Kofleriaceae bacterium]